MKAWLLEEQTGLGAMKLVDDHPVPEPEENEVRLKVRYAGLNPADYYLAKKMYPAKPALPHILGRDGMGTVDKAGAKASRFKEGDPVTVLRGDAGVGKPGLFAEYCCVPEDRLVPVPEGWEETQAAGAPLVFLTAYQALNQWGEVGEGHIALATGASGGVGLASVMLAKAQGAKVIGLSRSDEKAREIEELGADLVLKPDDPELVNKIKRFATPTGVSVAVDNIGGDLFPKLVATLGRFGAISCVGRLAGPVPEFNTATLFFKRLRIGGVSAGDYSAEEALETWDKILDLLNASGRKPVVDSVWEFPELIKAFERLQEGPMGKVVVKVGAS